ncbi:MAG: mucoidy inhibitor MuiA family protein [Verrucomicrobia bacterium]|nr:mucoidy inhibitor MuiA family protein [Verrucomicrobiota bacterium]
MKHSLIFALLISSAPHPSLGAEATAFVDDDAQPLASRITQVTVYADRAQVTRVASVNAPAEATGYLFAKLPGWIDEGSVRVSLTPPEAGQVLDVQVRRTYLARADDSDIRKAETAARDIGDEIAALDDEKGILDAQAKQLDSIRMFSLEKLPKDVATREIKPEEYGASVKFIASSLREIAQAKRDLEKKRRELQPELNARQRQLNELRQRAQLEQRNVVVTLKGTAKPAALSLTYLLPGATWEPVHELRATPDGRTVSLTSFAVVMQTTGEDWTDAALSLSTQKSTETMKIPELEALLVGGRKLPRLLAAGGDTFAEATRNWAAQNTIWFDVNNRDFTSQQAYRANQAAQLGNIKRVEQVFEILQERGTTAHFPALSPQIVRSDGRPVRVPIGTAELAAQHRIFAAPEMSLNAARIVDLTNATRQPLLPGRVSLFLGGAFLGLTEAEFAAPGEGFALYLGVADQVKLSRTLDKKRSSLARGGSKTRMQVSFVVNVENLSDQGVALQLTDRIPVSESDEVRVSGARIQPEGKPDAKGLLHWDLNLAGKQAREFRIEYTLEYPTELPKTPKSVTAIPGKPTGIAPMPGIPAASAPALAPPSSGIHEQIRSLERKF